MFLRQEKPAWPAQVGGLALVEAGALLDESGRLRLEHVRDRVSRRLAPGSRLRQRLLKPPPFGGPPLWVDDDAFSIGNHVLERAVRPPGRELDLLETAASIYADPLDRRHPLWELWFLTGLIDGRVGVLLKLHHSVADGLAAMAIVASFLDFEPDAPDPAPKRWEPAPPPERWTLVADSFRSKVRRLGRATSSLVHPMRLLSRTRLGLRMAREALAQTANPNTSLNAVVGAGRRVRFIRLDLAAIKELAHAHGGKVNDVVLELWAGGLRHLLQARHESVSTDLIATMTVSLRSAQGAQIEGNELGFVQLPLPIGESDASHRLDLIIENTREAKTQQQPAEMAGFIAAISAAPVVRYMSSRQKTVNVKVSNVPGSPVRLYLLGSRVTDMLPIMRLLGNVGVALCALSYAGGMYLAVTADAAGFPDIDVLMEGMSSDWSGLVGEPASAAREAAA